MRQIFWNSLPGRKRRQSKAARLAKTITLGGVAWIGGMWLLLFLVEGSPLGERLASALGFVGWCVFAAWIAYYFRVFFHEEKDTDRDIW